MDNTHPADVELRDQLVRITQEIYDVFVRLADILNATRERRTQG